MADIRYGVRELQASGAERMRCFQSREPRLNDRWLYIRQKLNILAQRCCTKAPWTLDPRHPARGRRTMARMSSSETAVSPETGGRGAALKAWP